MNRSSKIAVAAAATSLVSLTMVGTALAGSPMPSISAQGVEFSGGNYLFPAPNGNYHLKVTGVLYDRATDGHNVFAQSQVMGFPYRNRTYGGGGKALYALSDGDTYANYGHVQACTDRGTLGPDSCGTVYLDNPNY